MIRHIRRPGASIQHSWLFKGLTGLVLLAGPAQTGLGLVKNMVHETQRSGTFLWVASGQTQGSVRISDSAVKPFINAQ